MGGRRRVFGPAFSLRDLLKNRLLLYNKTDPFEKCLFFKTNLPGITQKKHTQKIVIKLIREMSNMFFESNEYFDHQRTTQSPIESTRQIYAFVVSLVAFSL